MRCRVFFSSDAKCDPAHFYEYRYCNKKLFLPIYIFYLLFERKRSTAATCRQLAIFSHFCPKLVTQRLCQHLKIKRKKCSESFEHATALLRGNKYSCLDWMFDFIPIFLIYPLSFLNTEGLKPMLVMPFFS